MSAAQCCQYSGLTQVTCQSGLSKLHSPTYDAFSPAFSPPFLRHTRTTGPIRFTVSNSYSVSCSWLRRPRFGNRPLRVRILGTSRVVAGFAIEQVTSASASGAIIITAIHPRIGSPPARSDTTNYGCFLGTTRRLSVWTHRESLCRMPPIGAQRLFPSTLRPFHPRKIAISTLYFGTGVRI